MRKIHAAISGVYGYVPDYILTNQELETMVDTNDEWIRTRTGINERRILKGKEMGVSEIGVKVINGLLEKTNTSPDEIDLVICATVTGDMVFPDTANIVCDKVGIKNAFSFDINAACSGFLFAFTTGAQFITSGMCKKVIVLGMDKMSSIIDYEDRATCVIFGDGGGAVLLEPNEEEVGFIDAELKSNGVGRHYLHMKAGGSFKPASIETITAKEHYVYQDGKPVFKHAVRGMSSTLKTVMQRNNLSSENVHWVVPHQANMRIITAVANAADFPMEKVMVNIHKYGNTTAGTLPLCLWEWEPRLNKGDNILLTAFGGGFTWGTVYLKWAY